MAWEYDKIKAQIFFTHLLRASKKFEERHIAKEELASSLKKLSKAKVNKEFKNEIRDLKKKIGTLMEKQTRIITAHGERVKSQESLKDKVYILEKKLSQYIEDKKRKNKRINELEVKISAKQGKETQLATLRGELEGLEIIYESLKESGQLEPSQLRDLENKISLLKIKLETLEKKK